MANLSFNLLPLYAASPQSWLSTDAQEGMGKIEFYCIVGLGESKKCQRETEHNLRLLSWCTHELPTAV